MLVHGKNMSDVKEKYQWAAVVVRVHNGFRIFAYPYEYAEWMRSER
jgi:hypothetical protein